jgi:sortase (surface protein transpeptidase)
MDQKTYLKEMAKHAQRNTTNIKREDSNQKKVQIKTFKSKDDYDRLTDSIDINSLELFAKMMRDRYGNRSENED